MRITSFAILLAGLSWAVYSFLKLSGAALPYQDPTLEMLKQQASQVKLWQYSFLAGGLAASFGGLGLWKFRRNGKSHNDHVLDSET